MTKLVREVENSHWVLNNFRMCFWHVWAKLADGHFYTRFISGIGRGRSNTRGATRLDCARGKKLVWRPHVRT